MSILNQLALSISSSGINLPQTSADTLLNNGLNIFYTIAGIVAVIVIIFAGISYTTSNGNSETVSKAKNAILYAAIGLVVIILAFAITWFVIGRFVQI